MSNSLTLKAAQLRDLRQYAQMEAEAQTASFLGDTGLDNHKKWFSQPEILYLSILEGETIVGFFILALEDGGRTIEFRRVVVAAQGHGIGQKAIALMEEHCRKEIGAETIWLDVFDHNNRARHIYEKLGYHYKSSTPREKGMLLVYEKTL